MEVKEVDYNPEFIARMIPKVDWLALRQATEQVSYRAVLEGVKCCQYFSSACNYSKSYHVRLSVSAF